MSEGDILICKKHNILYGNENIVGRRYVIKKIENDGNKNIYVSTDLRGYNEGVSICYSPVKVPDMLIPYSTKYINDYFDELVEIRDNKLVELGING